jgi:DNA-binding NarL/FixJ family response regulator
MTGTELRVLVVDDHRLFREGVRALLDSIEGVRVVAEAGDGEEAIGLALEHAPDVVLMDVEMPGTNGLDATRRILAERPGIRVVVVTMFEDPDLVFAALRAGARGYVLKGAAQDELLRAIRTVAEGHAIYDAKIADRMLSFFRASRGDLPLGAFPELTDREREVLDRLARGEGNATIARRLGIAGKTVRNHVSTVLSKLQVTDRTQAALKAREAGFGVEPGDDDSGEA